MIGIRSLRATALAGWLLVTVTATAHRGVHEQIASASHRIEADPANAALYLQRGELYRLHGDWNRARADLERAAALDDSLMLVHLARGRMELDAGDARTAAAALDRFLTGQPRHAEGRLTRARALVRLGRLSAAVEDYGVAIAESSTPSPDLYYERAQALVRAARPDEALRGLDEGLVRLGVIPSLQRQAVEIELARKRWDAALSRLETIAIRAPRKESHLAEKGAILERAGRLREALDAYREALLRIAALPDHHRGTPAVRELSERLHSALQRHQQPPAQ